MSSDGKSESNSRSSSSRSSISSTNSSGSTCIAIKHDGTTCTSKAAKGFKTCRVDAHRKQENKESVVDIPITEGLSTLMSALTIVDSASIPKSTPTPSPSTSTSTSASTSTSTSTTDSASTSSTDSASTSTSAPTSSTNSASTSTTDSASTSIKSKPDLSWYKITEIAFSDFVLCCKDIYSVIEEQHKSKSSEDPFLKAVVLGHGNLSEESWNELERVRLAQKALEMKMGDFHEELIGKFAGYETYPNGHETGCDVGKKDKTEVFEVKNRHNTVKGSDGKYIVSRLQKEADSGKKAVFVQINCPDGKVSRFGAPSTTNVSIWNGKETYAYLSKRESFFDDLLATIKYVFLHFKKYDDLKKLLLETSSPASPSPTPA